MNDEILILVVGGSSNKEAAALPDILRARGCAGKVSYKKISPEALKKVQAAVAESEAKGERHRKGAWG